MDKLVLLVGILIVVGIGYFAVHVGSRESVSTVTSDETNNMPEAMSEIVDAESGDPDVLPDDLAGLHIMADGTVMLGNGDVIEDATVLESGDIEFTDGRVLTPLMDMR